MACDAFQFTSPFSKVLVVFTCPHYKRNVVKIMHFHKSPYPSALSGVLVWTMTKTHQKVRVLKETGITVGGAGLTVTRPHTYLSIVRRKHIFILKSSREGSDR